jgi:hypothetical protein
MELIRTGHGRELLRVRASFNFAESSRVKPPQVGRRNRAVDKKKGDEHHV